MEILFVIIIVFLIGLLFFTQYKNKKTINSYNYLIERSKGEVTATLEVNKENYEKELENKITSMKVEKEEEIRKIELDHMNEVKRMNKYISNLEKYSRNRGEILTHEILCQIKNSLIKKGILASEEMIIMGNIFIPFPYKENELMSRQIDHLILLPNNIYIIETKYWQGKVLQGLSKENAGELSNILNTLYPSLEKGIEKTLVVGSAELKGDKKIRELNIVSYGNPVNQVRDTARKLNEYIKEKTHKKKLVKTIVFFGYPTDENNYVKVYSKKPDEKDNLATMVCTDSQELGTYLSNEIINSNKVYSVDELNEIQTILSEYNRI